MSEQFAIFDASGRHIGIAPRDRVHREGLWHRAANVFLFRSDGRLLIQRRQHNKDVCPGAWDLSVAEHVKPGEQYAEAAARGLFEELGAEQVQLEPLGCVIASQLEVKERGLKDYEFQRSFRAVFDGAVFPSPDEVAEIRFVFPAVLAADFERHPDAYTPWFRERAFELGVLQSGAGPVW